MNRIGPNLAQRVTKPLHEVHKIIRADTAPISLRLLSKGEGVTQMSTVMI
jgi:hypothetical protein